MASHLIRQATESYMERRDASGLVPHECSSFSRTNSRMLGTAYSFFTPSASMRERLTNGVIQCLQKRAASACTRCSIGCLWSANQSQSQTPAVRMTLVHMGTSAISRGIQQVSRSVTTRSAFDSGVSQQAFKDGRLKTRRTAAAAITDQEASASFCGRLATQSWK
jgi:hypothetical protein